MLHGCVTLNLLLVYYSLSILCTGPPQSDQQQINIGAKVNQFITSKSYFHKHVFDLWSQQKPIAHYSSSIDSFFAQFQAFKWITFTTFSLTTRPGSISIVLNLMCTWFARVSIAALLVFFSTTDQNWDSILRNFYVTTSYSWRLMTCDVCAASEHLLKPHTQHWQRRWSNKVAIRFSLCASGTEVDQCSAQLCDEFLAA